MYPSPVPSTCRASRREMDDHNLTGTACKNLVAAKHVPETPLPTTRRTSTVVTPKVTEAVKPSSPHRYVQEDLYEGEVPLISFA